jgi:ketosteroid isomerase-like protein
MMRYTRATSRFAVSITLGIVLAALLVSAGASAHARPMLAPGAPDRAIVEQTIRDSIGWALTKDRPLLERIMAHDPALFIFNPDSKSVIGWDAFVKGFDVWMDPRFKATSLDVRDLRVSFSPSGEVAWYSAILDDLGEWDGKPVGWKDTRWTGVLEKRGGAWVIVQMHFSFASDRPAVVEVMLLFLTPVDRSGGPAT